MSITIKKEESPIVVPLLGSGDKETKSESVPSLHYPSSTSRASSWLSSYHTHLPAHRFSPYWRGDLSDSIYHPTSIIRSPTPLAQPVDWRPVFNHRVATDTTIVPSSSSSETYIDPIDYALRRVYLPSEVSDIIREGLQLGLQQRAEVEHRAQIWQRVFEARARIEERLNREVRLPPCNSCLPNPILRHWFRGNPPPPALHNHISSLRPRQSLRIPARYCEVYTCH